MLSMIGIGLFLGLLHALEADHVATVATLATNQSSGRQMIKQGLAWGLGHSATLLIIGMIVLGAGTLIPEDVAQWLERGVGLMMILLALDVVRRLVTRPVHIHQHHTPMAIPMYTYTATKQTNYLNTITASIRLTNTAICNCHHCVLRLSA